MRNEEYALDLFLGLVGPSKFSLCGGLEDDGFPALRQQQE